MSGDASFRPLEDQAEAALKQAVLVNLHRLVAVRRGDLPECGIAEGGVRQIEPRSIGEVERFRATNPYPTFGQILSANVLKSPMTLAVGVLNGGHSNGRVKPASFSRLRLSAICSTVPIRILLPFPFGV